MTAMPEEIRTALEVAQRNSRADAGLSPRTDQAIAYETGFQAGAQDAFELGVAQGKVEAAKSLFKLGAIGNVELYFATMEGDAAELKALLARLRGEDDGGGV